MYSYNTMGKKYIIAFIPSNIFKLVSISIKFISSLLNNSISSKIKYLIFCFFIFPIPDIKSWDFSLPM